MWEATATTTAEGQVLWALQALGHPLPRRTLGRPSRILLLRANAYTAQPQTPLLEQPRYLILGQGLLALGAGLQHGLRPVVNFYSDGFAICHRQRCEPRRLQTTRWWSCKGRDSA